MLREGTEYSTVEVESASTRAPTRRSEERPDWRAVDRALRAISQGMPERVVALLSGRHRLGLRGE